jgi:hypothetical protein
MTEYISGFKAFEVLDLSQTGAQTCDYMPSTVIHAKRRRASTDDRGRSRAPALERSCSFDRSLIRTLWRRALRAEGGLYGTDNAGPQRQTDRPTASNLRRQTFLWRGSLQPPASAVDGKPRSRYYRPKLPSMNMERDGSHGTDLGVNSNWFKFFYQVTLFSFCTIFMSFFNAYILFGSWLEEDKYILSNPRAYIVSMCQVDVAFLFSTISLTRWYPDKLYLGLVRQDKLSVSARVGVDLGLGLYNFFSLSWVISFLLN